MGDANFYQHTSSSRLSASSLCCAAAGGLKGMGNVLDDWNKVGSDIHTSES